MPGPCKARRKTPSPAMPTAAAASTAAVPVNGANGVAGWAAAEFKNTECARAQRMIAKGIARICLANGFDGIHELADATFTDLTCQFLTVFLRTATDFATNSGRTQASLDDVARATGVVYSTSDAVTKLAAYVSESTSVG
eukprot:m.80215 g.80215  ORF g.80215 m.80215 type:complete len:140 (+) comp10883_c0_seq2:168-587(+)